jgi:hypothetical protein
MFIRRFLVTTRSIAVNISELFALTGLAGSFNINISYSVTPAGGRGDGSVPFAVRYDRNLPVVVNGIMPPVSIEPLPPPSDVAFVIKQTPKPFLPPWAGFAFIVTVLAALLLLIWRQSSRLARFLRMFTRRKKAHPVAEPDKYFYCTDGTVLRDLHDLKEALGAMKDDDIHHYVTLHKNDFSHWVDDSLGLHALAAKLSKKRTRQELRKVLEHELK